MASVSDPREKPRSLPTSQAVRAADVFHELPQVALRRIARDTDSITAALINDAADRIDELEEHILNELRLDLPTQ